MSNFSRSSWMAWFYGLLVCSGVMLCSAPGLADTAWQLAKEEDGITVYTRDVDGFPVKQFKASTKISASLATVLAVMLDSDACPEWVYRCENAKVLERHSFGDRYVYRTINLPWPLTDRDIVMHKVVTEDPETRTITIRNTAVPDFFPRTKLVRIEVSESVYLLEPQADGTVKLTWTQLSDPAGALPKALVNQMLLTSPMSTLRSLRKMVRKKKYRNVAFSRDAHGMLTGFTQK